GILPISGPCISHRFLHFRGRVGRRPRALFGAIFPDQRIHHRRRPILASAASINASARRVARLCRHRGTGRPALVERAYSSAVPSITRSCRGAPRCAAVPAPTVQDPNANTLYLTCAQGAEAVVAKPSAIGLEIAL